jgi:two-component system phosphate regulon sensor histidine kinase PhoR
MTESGTWADDLHEGVLLVDGPPDRARVRWLNARAGELLQVDRDRAVGAPLMAVLRDHRLERAALEREAAEVETRGRILRVRPVSGGISLVDISEAKRSRDDARTLLAVLSHELRTPATTVGAALEALSLDLDDSQRERFLDHARAECARLVRLLEDLTVESAPPRERRLELGQVVARAIRVLAPMLEPRNVTVSCDVPELLVWADEDKLLQVLLNLLENAAIHGPAQAAVTVRAAPEMEAVRVTVTDCGAPLPPDAMAVLFDAGSGAGSGRSASRKGSGLGLYIVRSIVERWGGRAWGRALAEGNEFGFTVPAVRGRATSG